jgi:hypothetical protein
MPVASPRRQPTSSRAHSGGAPSPSSSLSSFLLGVPASPPAPARAAPPSARPPRLRFESRRSRFRRSSRTRLRRGVTGESGSNEEGSAASPDRSGSRSLPAMAAPRGGRSRRAASYQNRIKRGVSVPRPRSRGGSRGTRRVGSRRRLAMPNAGRGKEGGRALGGKRILISTRIVSHTEKKMNG